MPVLRDPTVPSAIAPRSGLELGDRIERAPKHGRRRTSTSQEWERERSFSGGRHRGRPELGPGGGSTLPRRERQEQALRIAGDGAPVELCLALGDAPPRAGPTELDSLLATAGEVDRIGAEIDQPLDELRDSSYLREDCAIARDL